MTTQPSIKDKHSACAGAAVEEQYFQPAVDVFEGDQGYRLRIELPGVSRENLEITLDQGVLTLRGRQSTKVQEGFRAVRKEYLTGVYSRSFRLPEDVESIGINANLEQGVLLLDLPRKEAAKPRVITVN